MITTAICWTLFGALLVGPLAFYCGVLRYRKRYTDIHAHYMGRTEDYARLLRDMLTVNPDYLKTPIVASTEEPVLLTKSAHEALEEKLKEWSDPENNPNHPYIPVPRLRLFKGKN